jgi:son of sevenless
MYDFFLIPQGVPQKQKLQLDSVRKLADHARNYHEYRSRLRETVPPAVPFLGAFSGQRHQYIC